MIPRLFTVWFLLVALAIPAVCFETDQYNLPPEPLRDIGPEVSEYLLGHLRETVDVINDRIEYLDRCLQKRVSQECPVHDAAFAELLKLRSGESVAERYFYAVGDGSIFVTKSGRWFSEHRFRAQPDLFKTSYEDSIYFFKPSNQLTLSPTVNLYGHHLGWDKVEHLLQQGWRYHTIARAEVLGGATPDDAVKKAIAWGVRTERTYYGLLTSGVYSNGDLAANIAGMRFYENIYGSVTLGNRTLDPIITMVNGRWRIASDADERILRPYITHHLNEALNPSVNAVNIFPTVARVVRTNACPKWRAAYTGEKKAALFDAMDGLDKWFGSEYGYRGAGRRVYIGDCFADQLPSNSSTSRSAS